MGKIPRLRFPEFHGEWEDKKLGAIADRVMYGMNAAAIPFDGINKYLRITDINDDSRKFEANPLTSPSGEIEDKYKLQKGDIVFARTGASVGKSYLYTPNDGNLLFAGFLIKFSIINANPYFIFSQTLKSNYDKWIKKMSMRSGQPGINAEEYKELVFNIPSIAEQQKIADFLTLIDEHIEKSRIIIEGLTSFKSAVSKKIFSQELRFKDENGKDFPKWGKYTLGDVLIKNSTKNREQKYKLVESVSNKHGFINQEEYFEDRIVASKDTSNYYVIQKGYFAYNPSRINVGSLAYKRDENTSIISPLYISFKADTRLDDEFLLSYFFSEQFIKQMNRSFEGSVRNTLSYDNLVKMDILLPCKAEQQKISSFLVTLNNKIDLETALLQQLKLQKQYLLQQLFI